MAILVFSSLCLTCCAGEDAGVQSLVGVREEPWSGLSAGESRSDWLPTNAQTDKEAALLGRCFKRGILLGVSGSLKIRKHTKKSYSPLLTLKSFHPCLVYH